MYSGMATTEMSVTTPNNSVETNASSDIEEDIVVCRKSKNNILLSDDDENDAIIEHAKTEAGNKEFGISEETITAIGFRIENRATGIGDKEPDKYSLDPSNTVKQSRKNIDSNISEGIDGDTVESKDDVIFSHFSTNISAAEDVENEKRPYRNPNRFTSILDSDSEDERVYGSLVKKKMSPSSNVSLNSRSTSPVSDYSSQRKGDEKVKSVNRPTRIINSESENENEDESTDQRETSTARMPEDIRLSQQSTGSNNNNISRSNKISALIDSDSEEDNPVTQRFGGPSDEDESMTKSNTKELKKKRSGTEKKKRTGSIRAAKEEALREIHSESQRMLRESQICLPYHRPKQRTLQEFLNRRKKLPTLPATLTTAAKVKMSGEIVGKVLEEKEKEAELFYQSSSDSDNEGDAQTKITDTIIEPTPTAVENESKNNVENISAIEETQKITRNDPKISQGDKEVIQQGVKSLGLPRKLFDCPENEAEATEVSSPMVEEDPEKTAEENKDCIQKRKEFKQGLKDVSLPRKLFGAECVEPMVIDHEQATKKREKHDKIDEVQEICEMKQSQMRVSRKSDQFSENSMIDNLHESMEEEVEDFELKISEDLCEITNDKPALQDISIPESSTTGFEAITVTPFINNREVFKLNENEGKDSGIIVADEDSPPCSPHNDQMNSKDIELSSAYNEQSLSINSKTTCSNEDCQDKYKPIGHVFGLPLPELDDEKPKKISTRILPDIMKLTPTLQGFPDTVIELSPPEVGVNQLIKRFLTHSVAKKTSEFSPEVSTVRTEKTAGGLIVINEVLPYRIPINEKNDDPELSKPGAKLVRLKEDLQHQMAIQRTKEREKKELEMKSLEAEDVYHDELSDCGMEEENDINEGEEEELRSDGESESDENDLPIKETNKKYKSPFVDGEAEVSGEDGEYADDEEDEEDEEDREDGDNNNSLCGDDEDEENEGRETSLGNRSGKSKRIVKAFQDDDSNDFEVKVTSVNASEASNDRRFGRKRTDVDMFAADNNSDDDWLSGTEGDLAVYQQRNDERSQSCATPSVTNNSLSIVSPITQLTALNTGSELVNRDLRSSENSSQSIVPFAVETTPIEVKNYRECNSEKREKLQKKLFDDVRETPNDAELMGLCSGQFSDSPGDTKDLDRLVHSSRKTNVSDAELLELCSGTFATQPAAINKLEAASQKVEDDSVPSLPSRDESQKKQLQKADTISNKFKIIFSSDDEEHVDKSQAQNAKGKNLKKKVRQLKLSDDEEESDGESSSSFDERENGEEQFVDYDSDENEIVVAKRDVKKAAARFLDKEAELSESDWGSADEDERDLDKLELEEGDLEDIDQNQVKDQLEKIHMRQVLDDDQREVRLLQEMLLEDGELHSDNASRQRKFKWKNIDKLGEDGEDHLSSVDEEGASVDQIEAESELEWRKKRLEREKFLQERRMKNAAAGVEEETEDSQLIQLGLKALKKTKNTKVPDNDVSQSNDNSQSSVVRHTVADLFASPLGCRKNTSALQTAIHRGSFLARGEESLARLSVITRQNSDQAIITTKKSRNFVFAHLSPAIETPVEEEKLAGETTSDTAKPKLRKRKPPFSLTPLASKKAKK